jgi:hypothetical protein
MVRISKVFILIFILIISSGCVKKQPVNDEFSIDINQAAESLFCKLGVSFARTDDEIAKEAYGLDKSEFGDLGLYQAIAATNADVIVIINAKDSGNLAEARESLAAFHEMNLATWNIYLPMEYIKVENYMIIEKGLYLFYIVSDMQEDMKQAVDGLFADG